MKRSLLALVVLSLATFASAQGTYEEGVSQLPGAEGKFGQTYTVLKNSSPVNLTILGAEYTLAPFNVADQSAHMAQGTEKLLVIHFKLKNPTHDDLYVNSEHMFQAVDSKGNLIQDSGDLRQVTEKAPLNLTLKPGQGTDEIVTYIVVPAAGSIPKLILTYPPAATNLKVVRFNLNAPTNKVKPLVAPDADPADKTGSTALQTLPGIVGTAYGAGYLTLSVDAIALRPGPLGGHTAADGNQFLVATVTLNNPSWQKVYYPNNILFGTVKEDGDKVVDHFLLKGKTDEDFGDFTFESGDTLTHRIVFEVPKAQTLKTLTLFIDYGNDGKTRSFVYDVSGIK